MYRNVDESFVMLVMISFCVSTERSFRISEKIVRYQSQQSVRAVDFILR